MNMIDCDYMINDDDYDDDDCAANTKKCPRCQTPIEKDEGCNHMACRKCRHEFCWICMKDWHTHSQHTGTALIKDCINMRESR